VSNQSSDNGAHEPEKGPLTTEQVLIEEAHAIGAADGQPVPARLRRALGLHAGAQTLGVSGDGGDALRCRECASEQHKLYQALNDLDRAALCLSGGGIRSAAFSLGVIQALATHPRPKSPHAMFAGEAAPDGSVAEFKPQTGIENGPYNAVARPEDSLLAQMQYLSTVSGGGYIGSWLSAWLTRAGEAGATTRVIVELGGHKADGEPPQITNLRSDSSYLTPKTGALSADLWADLAMIIRNLVLNWAVILPLLCALVLGAKGYAAIEYALMQPSHDGLSGWLWAALIAALVAFMVQFS
jgi:hypothetical protein